MESVPVPGPLALMVIVFSYQSHSRMNETNSCKISRSHSMNIVLSNVLASTARNQFLLQLIVICRMDTFTLMKQGLLLREIKQRL